ncbi:MAG TPA: N-acetylmuramoyl-L-alanine amidase [Caulobacteraceae bacterium]
MAKAHWWGAVLAALVLCAGQACAQVQDIGVRLGVGPTGTRVVIDSPTAVDAVPAVSEDQRLVFDLAGVDLAEPLKGAGQGLVTGWRLEKTDSGARLTLDLSGRSDVAHRFSIPPRAEMTHFRYVIDLTAAIDGASLAPAPVKAARTHVGLPWSARRIVAIDGGHDLGAQNANSNEENITLAAAIDGVMRVPAPVKAARTHASMRPPARKVVVIDAGHGGHDPGAQSANSNEKDITLAAARHLQLRLERSGRYRVVMTRTTDVFVPLEDRVRIARRAGADLFIALHADSAGPETATHGASVYTLSDHGVTRVNQVLDGHEWFNHATARSDPAVKGILLDLTQRATLNRSNEFAQLLVDRLSEKVDLLPRSHRDAGYFVLLAPDVPAVLLEMGFISSPADEARLTDPVQRNEMMDAVATAIDAYFDGEVRVAAN